MWKIALVCALSVVLGACVVIPRDPYRGIDRSRPLPVWVRYCPYVDFRDSELRPVPYYMGWTDDRMNRDLQSMTKARVTAALVELSPSAIMRAEVRERLWRFGELSSKSRVRVALLLVPDKSGTLKMRRANVLRFLETQQFGSLPGALKQADRVVVVLSERIVLDSWQSPSPESLYIRHLGHDLPACPNGPKSYGVDEHGVMWARAGERGGSKSVSEKAQRLEWPLARDGGVTLRDQLILARRQNAKLVLLNSWNDYSDGSAVETNSIEGDGMLNILQRR